MLFTFIGCSKHRDNHDVYLIEVISKNGNSNSITNKDTIINFFSALDKSNERNDILKYSGKYYLKCFSKTDTVIYSINNNLYNHTGKIYQVEENLETVLGL